jgi:hypothetical protein
MTVILEWDEPEGVSGNANRPIIVVDSGYAVDPGVYCAPDQPRSLDQPRCLMSERIQGLFAGTD